MALTTAPTQPVCCGRRQANLTRAKDDLRKHVAKMISRESRGHTIGERMKAELRKLQADVVTQVRFLEEHEAEHADD